MVRFVVGGGGGSSLSSSSVVVVDGGAKLKLVSFFHFGSFRRRN